MNIIFNKKHWKYDDCLIWLYNHQYSSFYMIEDTEYYYFRQQ